MQANAKETMLSATDAVEDIDVRRRLFGMTLECFNLVVFRMAAARSDLLIMLQMLDVVLL